MNSQWDYFGVRYYAPELKIFTQVDPLADKYPSLSPYLYCADNPMNILDENGDSLFILIGDKYVNWYDLPTDLSELPEEVRATIADLTILYSSQEGSELLNEIVNNKYRNTIDIYAQSSEEITGATPASVKDAADPTVGSAGNISYDPYSTKSGQDEKGNKSVMPFISLGHELIHTKYYNEGRNFGEAVNSKTGAKYEEERAVRDENRIRMEFHIPMRIKY